MTSGGFLVWFFIFILIVIIVALIAVIGAVSGAVAGIVVGAVVDICWLVFLSDIGIYEIIPGFVASMIAAVVVTLITKKPSEDIEKLYDNSVAYTE